MGFVRLLVAFRLLLAGRYAVPSEAGEVCTAIGFFSIIGKVKCCRVGGVWWVSYGYRWRFRNSKSGMLSRANRMVLHGIGGLSDGFFLWLSG